MRLQYNLFLSSLIQALYWFSISFLVEKCGIYLLWDQVSSDSRPDNLKNQSMSKLCYAIVCEVKSCLVYQMSGGTESV